MGWHCCQPLFSSYKPNSLRAQGTAFTYQGRLDSRGAPYSGTAEFHPTLWNAESGGAKVADNAPAALTVTVTDGLFDLPLDFGGGPFTGSARWLQLEVRTDASATVTATPNPGYKFSKWLENGAVVSTAGSYTFTVNSNRALVAKFKPVYTVVVNPDPPAGGDVEADPFYEVGELAKIKAVPNPGWSFVNWTQNGVVVSDDVIYQFNVTGNRTLVGHFAPGHRIDVSAEPVNGGTASGGGVYPAGSTATVEAAANPGYVFLRWTENGNPVSTSASYSFAATASRTLVETFAAQPRVTATQAAPDALVISWPAGASGWVLQECSDLTLGDWADSARAVSVVGNRKEVTVSPRDGQRFFRLGHP